MPLHSARIARNASDTLRERFGRASRAGRHGSLVLDASEPTEAPGGFNSDEHRGTGTLFPPAFPFPVHWLESGMDLGLDYGYP